MIFHLEVSAPQQGLLEITHKIAGFLSESKVENGLCTIFIKHTSASLIIQENADPTAKNDLEKWLNKTVKNESYFQHTYEGVDDMPSHIKSVLTATSLSIPIENGRLTLGTWQGIYLWEHRLVNHRRQIVVHILAD